MIKTFVFFFVMAFLFLGSVYLASTLENILLQLVFGSVCVSVVAISCKYITDNN